jgi:ribosomal-protein-serine acetyltransferase
MRPVLSNGQVKIRCYDLSDVAPLFEAARESVAQAFRWLPWCHPGYTVEESLEWVLRCQKTWDEGLEYNFAIFDQHTEAFLGGTGLNELDRPNRRANLGYWVRSNQTGRGIATAAARLTATFGFETARLNRLEITAATENRASQRVAEKLGGMREGILRQRFVIDGAPQDAVTYSLLRDEWKR